MRDFELLEPRSVPEASRMLIEHGEDARLLAGGTALLLALRQRLLTPSHVVFFGGIGGLNDIRYDERNGLRLGPLVRHAELAASPIVRSEVPMLADMAGRIANPQVRSQATLGGNLCYGDPATDPPTCLIALDAHVRLSGPDGERTLPLESFYVDYYETALKRGEVLTEVMVPPLGPAAGAYTRFLKTPAEHRPLVGVGVVARMEGRLCREVRIAIGASTPFPVRARAAEELLTGKIVTPDVLEEAAAMAASDIEPLSDFRAQAEYRREMVKVVLRRTVAALFDEPNEKLTP